MPTYQVGWMVNLTHGGFFIQVGDGNQAPFRGDTGNRCLSWRSGKFVKFSKGECHKNQDCFWEKLGNVTFFFVELRWTSDLLYIWYVHEELVFAVLAEVFTVVLCTNKAILFHSQNLMCDYWCLEKTAGNPYVSGIRLKRNILFGWRWFPFLWSGQDLRSNCLWHHFLRLWKSGLDAWDGGNFSQQRFFSRWKRGT